MTGAARRRRRKKKKKKRSTGLLRPPTSTSASHDASASRDVFASCNVATFCRCYLLRFHCSLEARNELERTDTPPPLPLLRFHRSLEARKELERTGTPPPLLLLLPQLRWVPCTSSYSDRFLKLWHGPQAVKVKWCAVRDWS